MHDLDNIQGAHGPVVLVTEVTFLFSAAHSAKDQQPQDTFSLT